LYRGPATCVVSLVAFLLAFDGQSVQAVPAARAGIQGQAAGAGHAPPVSGSGAADHGARAQRPGDFKSMAPTSPSSEPVFPDEWSFRRRIKITNPGAAELTDFQVVITLPPLFDFARARADGADVRITSADGITRIPFWIERWDPITAVGRLWVKVPSLPVGGTVVYMYYGSPTAITNSSGDATFEFFDDFEGQFAQGYWALGPARTIMTIDQPWETEGPHSLSVVPAPEGAPWTWYGYYGLEDCTGIGVAGSDDLTNWSKFSTNPLFTGGGERWPHVAMDGDTYHMVHTVEFCGLSWIVHRTSSDGMTWSAPTELVAPDSELVDHNQNPNLWHDPNDGQWYLYWFQGDLSTEWRLMARTAPTVEGLGTAPNELLLASPSTLAAPNMMYRDGEYFLSTEIFEGDLWKVRVFSGASPLGPFTALPGNPILDDDCGCMFQTPIGDTLYDFHCKRSDNVWRLDMVSGDLSQPRTSSETLDFGRWTSAGGSWTARITEQPDGATGVVASVVADGWNTLRSSFAASDYGVEVYGRLLGGRVLGLSARTPDGVNGYSLNLYEDFDDSDNLFLYRWSNGGAVEVWSDAVGPIAFDTWYKLGLRIGPDGVSVRLDDVLRTPTPVDADPDAEPGSIALYGEAGSFADFDEVKVTRYSALDPKAVVGPEGEVLPSNAPPAAFFISPADDGFYAEGVPVFMRGTATDPEDPPSSLNTEFRVEAQYEHHTRTIGVFDGDTATFVPEEEDDDAPSWLDLLYVATDTGALADTARVRLWPEVDLAPSAVSTTPASPATSSPTTYRFWIRNLGAMASPMFRWTLRGGGISLAEGDTVVAGDDSVEVVRTIAPTMTVGTHTLRVKVDTLAVVQETNESNNAASRSVTVVSNQPPALAPIADQVVDEGAELTVTVAATHPDSATQTLEFSIDAGAPTGASIDPVTGAFSWTPGEDQGPGTYQITIRVRDDGTPVLEDSETIDIQVNEVNVAPVLSGVPAEATIPEGAPYRFTAVATDADIPAQTLVFSLSAEAPPAASIDSTTGTFEWTPAEVDGPGLYAFEIRLSDGVDSTSAPIELNVTEVATMPITDLAAAPVKTGNDGDGTSRILLTWTATESGTTVEVYRAPFGGYPNYSDPDGTGPPPPSTYPPGPEWTLTSASAPGTYDEPATRDCWHYVAFVREGADVSSVSNRTDGTLNYRLADVSNGTVAGQGDNRVDTADLALLGFHYGASGPELVAVPFLDYAPTTDFSVDGRPLNDGKIDFEELTVLALEYGLTSAPGATAIPVAVAAADEMTLSAPATVSSGQVFDAVLRWSGSGLVHAVKTRLGWDDAIASPISASPGSYLTTQGGVMFMPAPGRIDVAVLGADRTGLIGSGDLVVVRFHAHRSGDPALRVSTIEARDGINHPIVAAVDVETEQASTPERTELAFASANPVRGSVVLRMNLAGSGPTSLHILDVGGRRVRMLVHESTQAGRHRVVWDGRDDHGLAVMPGLYFVRLTTLDGHRTRRLVWLR
jgi:Domain of unknown function (DUF2341)/Putative Ig domain/CARDB/FlgD Ig-like domain